jgi:hypothetical protein
MLIATMKAASAQQITMSPVTSGFMVAVAVAVAVAQLDPIE